MTIPECARVRTPMGSGLVVKKYRDIGERYICIVELMDNRGSIDYVPFLEGQLVRV